MKFFGLFGKEKALQAPARNGGWRTLINEPFSGAWQQNKEVKVDTALTFPAFYSCVTLISGDIGKLWLKLVRRSKDGIWTETENAAFSPVLKKPNHFQTRVEFYQQWITSKLVHGNTYVLKVRDNRGVVVSLYILDATRVRALVADNGDVFYEIHQDTLSGLAEAVITVPAREIIHDKMNALHHPLVGVSPVYACGLAALQGLKIQNNSTSFFSNGARPSGVLTAPGLISDEAAGRLKAEWGTRFTGENSGNVAVLGDGLTYQPMMMSAVDAQTIEQLRWTAETVCSVFHVPPYMIGVGAMPSYNNVQALNQQYYAQALQILIEQLEACLDEGLGLMTGPRPYGVEFDLDALLRMDTATQSKAFAEAIGAGYMSPNEARRKMDMPPVKGGETPYLQQQNYSLSALSERDKENPLAAPAPEPPEPPEETDDTERAISALRMKFAGALYAA